MQLTLKPLRQHNLKRVSGFDVLLCASYRFAKSLARETRFWLFFDLPRVNAFGGEHQRFAQDLFDFINFAYGFVVCRERVALNVSIGDDLKAVVDMVEDQDGVGDHEIEVGRIEGVRVLIGKFLEMPDFVVGDVSDCAAVELGEPGHSQRLYCCMSFRSSFRGSFDSNDEGRHRV